MPCYIFKLYKSKIHNDLHYLWQQPKQGTVHYNDKVWYDRQRVGHDPLERYMKYLSTEAGLSSSDYTNHSIRATVITLLDRAQFDSRHIIAITGHKSETSIKQYARGRSNKKKREMSDELANNILDKMPKIAPKEEPTDKTESAETPNTASFDLQGMDIFPVDEEDDDILLKFLNDNPNLERQTLPENNVPVPHLQTEMQVHQPNVTNVQNVQNIVPNMPAFVPKMFFPNSHVVINYNFK